MYIKYCHISSCPRQSRSTCYLMCPGNLDKRSARVPERAFALPCAACPAAPRKTNKTEQSERLQVKQSPLKTYKDEAAHGLVESEAEAVQRGAASGRKSGRGRRSTCACTNSNLGRSSGIWRQHSRISVVYALKCCGSTPNLHAGREAPAPYCA